MITRSTCRIIILAKGWNKNYAILDPTWAQDCRVGRALHEHVEHVRRRAADRRRDHELAAHAAAHLGAVGVEVVDGDSVGLLDGDPAVAELAGAPPSLPHARRRPV